MNAFIKTRITIKILVLMVMIFSIASCTNTPPPPPPVMELPVLEIKTQDIPIFKSFVGQTYGLKDINIRARVDGVLEGVHFKEGTSIKKGTLLYTIDRQPIQAKEAARMSDLAQANTMLVKAESDLSRFKPLAESNAVSKRDLDASVAQYDAAKASVEAAKANLRATQIELGYTRITAPISGIIGITKAKVGDYVGREPNPVILNTISMTDTIQVRFFLTENEFLQLSRRTEQVNFKEKAREYGIRLILSDNSEFNHIGKVDFIDRSIDPNTGSILLQASFPNPEQLLRPGLFAHVKFMYDFIEAGILVPKRSVRELQTIYQVFVLSQDGKVETRQIEVSHTVDQSYVVSKGLQAGDVIIAEGFEKVRPGMPVKPFVKNTSN